MPRVLILDQDQIFVSNLKKDPLSTVYPIVVVDSAKAAQAYLSKNEDVASVLIAVNTPDSSLDAGAYSVIQLSKRLRPKTRLFLVNKSSPIEFSKELKKLGIVGIVDSKTDYAHIVSLSGLSPLHFDEKRALAATTDKTRVDTQISADDKDFFPILASEFVSGSKSLFDLYVRLRAGSYIKILRAGDSFSPERLESYLKKGLTQFYMKTEVQEQYLAYCAKLSKNVVGKKINPLAKVSQVLNFGEETSKFLKTKGLSDQTLQFASTYVSHVWNVVRDLPIHEVPVMAKFMDHLVGFEHGVSTTMVSGLIAKQMNIESETCIMIVGVASLFHDIGLMEMPDSFQTEETAEMDPESLKLFNTHPDVGEKILSEIKGIRSAVLQSTLQHHLRRNKMKRSASAKMISRVSEIVGLSDEFVHAIRRNLHVKGAPDPLIAIEKEFPGFSDPVIDAFRRAFFKR